MSTRRARRRNVAEADRLYRSVAWRRIRRAILERDRRVCWICGGYANTVDHVRPRAEGGADLDPANLRAACTSCNARGGAAVLARRRARGRERVAFFSDGNAPRELSSRFAPIRPDAGGSRRIRPPAGALAPEVDG